MYDDEFEIDPDARAYLEEFVVSFQLKCSLHLLTFHFALVMQCFDFIRWTMILVFIATVVSPHVVPQLTFAVLGHHVNTNNTFLDQLISVILNLSPPKHRTTVV
jgi:hypothetical protein